MNSTGFLLLSLRLFSPTRKSVLFFLKYRFKKLNNVHVLWNMSSAQGSARCFAAS